MRVFKVGMTNLERLGFTTYFRFNFYLSSISLPLLTSLLGEKGALNFGRK